MTQTPDSPTDVLTRTRARAHQRLLDDPFLGYESLSEAIHDCKATSQAEVVARLFAGENLFISGPAGSGKTFVINRFLEHVDAEFEGRVNVAITASTGIAAQLLGGKTIHSWSGIGINTEVFTKPSPMEWAKRDQIISTDILVIDEISMLPGYLFTRLDALLKFMRRSKQPFGGIQLVVMGDFMQLPPVDKQPDDAKQRVDTGYSARTDAWSEAKFEYCYMDKVHRATDRELKYVLNSIANGRADDAAKAFVNKRVRATKDPNKKYTTLFTTNKNVDRYNEEKLAENTNIERRMQTHVSGDPKHWPTIKKSNGIPEFFKVKLGATVILTANMNTDVASHANGSIGYIQEINEYGCQVLFNDGASEFISYKTYQHMEKYPVVSKKGNKTITTYQERAVSTVSAMPLKLGYAISVHKSQGQTFDGVEVDLTKIFAPGLGYVALSRVRQLDDLVILGITDRAYNVGSESLKISRGTRKLANKRRAKMLANLELSEKYFGRDKINNYAEAQNPFTENISTPEDSNIDPFAEVDIAEDTILAPVDNAGESSIGIEPEEITSSREIPPENFISYEQLLTNPLTREVIWEKKIENSIMRSRRLSRTIETQERF